MAELPYPHYRLSVQGPSETGVTLTLHVEPGAGGLLEGQTTESVVADIRRLLLADDSARSSSLTRFELTTTNNL